MERDDLPDGVTLFQEWRRIVFAPNGERDSRLDSGWYSDEGVAHSLLNDEHPEPTPTGYRFLLQTRWTSEARIVET